jgi:hypothetical protein
MASLELFGREVLPEFKERDEVRSREKAEQLEPVLEQVMGRREDDTPPLPEDYVMRALPKQMVENAGFEDGKKLLEQVAEKTAAGDRDALGILG